MLDHLKTGNEEVLEQLLSFLDSLPVDVYRTSYDVDGAGAIGRHMRHVLDLYRALMAMDKTGVIDYDKRNRESPIERDKCAAADELLRVLDWVRSLDDAADRKVKLKTEVSLYRARTVILDSTLLRELCYAASHTTHHLAMLVLKAERHGQVVDKHIGLAPATASYQRSVQEESRFLQGTANDT